MMNKVIIVLPAYNAAKTLERTFVEIPPAYRSDVILVDDFSSDTTVQKARELGIETIVHKRNLGYGGNQKTCYTAALNKGADIVVMLHPDYQYDPKKISALIQPIIDNQADVVLGSRVANKLAVHLGMPKWKYLANRFLTIIENVILRQHLTEYHTGFRAFHSTVLRSINFAGNSNDFVFDSQVLIQVAARKFRIGEIAVDARYFPEASSISFRRSVRYGLGTLSCLFVYLLHRLKLNSSPWLSDLLPKP